MSNAFADVAESEDDSDESEDSTPQLNTAVKQKVRGMPVTSDPDLQSHEKETSLNFPNDKDEGTFYSDVPTMIKWFLSVEGSTIEDFTEKDGAIVSVKGTLSKSFVKLQGSGRKSTAHSQMVSYGQERDS